MSGACLLPASTTRCRSSFGTAARVSYWYGEKEYSQRALDIRHVRRLLPETAFVAFPDCAHAEFVAGQPEAFAARLAETLERD